MPRRFVSSAGTLLATATSQRLTKSDATDPTAGRARFNAPLDAAEISVRRSEILLAGEEQRDVDGDAGEDCRLDRRQSFGSAGDLDEEIGLSSLPMEVARGRQSMVRVMGEKRRYLERHPAVDAIGPLEDRQEQLGGAGQVGEGSSKKSASPDFAERALRDMSSS